MKYLRLERVNLAFLLLTPIVAFSPARFARSSRTNDFWQIGPVIKGEDIEDEIIDVGEGGVRLAEESAIKVFGSVKHKPGNSDAQPMDLYRYNKVTELEETVVNKVLDKTGSSVLCKGSGVENYVDPGETTNKEVILAPLEAVKDAMSEAASAKDRDTLVFNFLGGDDLMIFEVLDAINHFVLGCDAKTQAKISFNSLCHSSFPSGTCTVNVVSVGSQADDEEGNSDKLNGAEKAIASGEIYFHEGSWYTVDESELNTALS